MCRNQWISDTIQHAAQPEQLTFDANFGLLTPEQTIVIRTYSDDTDDDMLADLRPRFIILYEPNQDFIRRIEVSSKELWGRLETFALLIRCIATPIQDWPSEFISCFIA